MCYCILASLYHRHSIIHVGSSEPRNLSYNKKIKNKIKDTYSIFRNIQYSKSHTHLIVILWFVVWMVCVQVCEKCLVQLCGAEVFVPWDLSLKELRCCKPSKRVRQNHTLQRLSSKRLYLHHISSPPSHSLSSYFSLKLSASTEIMLKIFLS